MSLSIKATAEKFNVSENALRGFAQSVILSLKADSMDDAFLAMSEDDRAEVMQEYAEKAMIKMKAFTWTYFNNDEAADQFRASVKSLL